MDADQPMQEAAEDGEATAIEQSEGRPPVSLEIFQYVRQAQAQHGLRHNDYKRYRQYCARKLHRTRKALKVTHGRGKFQAKKLEPGAVTDAKYLTLPLVNAERAWSLAKEVESQTQDGAAAHRHQHQVRRLAKAAQWAAELARLAAVRGNSRTHLEAEAYAAGLAGLALQHRGNDLSTAVSKFQRAELILQHLSQSGSFEQQHACSQQLEEVRSSLRFVKYELGRKGQQGAEAELATPVDDLKDSLDSLAAEQPASTSESTNTGSMTWWGITYEVRNKQVQANLQQVAEQQDSSMQTDQAVAGQHDGLIAALNTTKASLAAVLKAAPGGTDLSESDRQDLQQLERAVRGRLLELQLLKLSAQSHKGQAQHAALLDVSSSTAQPKAQAKQAESLVRLYDSMLTAAEALKKLAGEELRGAQAEHLENEAAAKATESKAGRCFYVAHSYLAASKHMEAHALFARSAQHAQAAVRQHQDCAHADALAVQKLQRLVEQAAAWQCVAHAEYAAAEQEAQNGVTQATSSLSLQPQQKPMDQKQPKYLLQSLDVWSSFAGESGKNAHFTPIPPALQQVAVRPFMLDNALNYIEAPSIEHRVAKQEQPKSAFAKLFTWGRK